MRCATDHLGCYGARYVNTTTIDELAARRRPLRPGDQRRAVDGARRPRRSSRACTRTTTAYLHWDAAARPDASRRSSARFGAHGYEVASFVFDTRLPLQGPRRRPTSSGRARRSTARSPGCARTRRAPVPPLLPQLGDAHAVRRSLHAERKDWHAAKAGGHRRHPVRLGRARSRPCARAIARRSSASRRCSSHRSSSELESARPARAAPSFAFLSDHGESWGERFASKEDVQGRLPHARRDGATTRSSRCR